MERVHYRRVADGTRRPQSAGGRGMDGESSGVEGGAGGFIEKFIAQAIIAALILVAVMGVCLLDFDFTLTARNGLRQALEGQETFEGLANEIKTYTASWFSQEDATLPAEVMPETVPVGTVPGAAVPDGVINTAVNGDESKSPVPEPPLYPEP